MSDQVIIVPKASRIAEPPAIFTLGNSTYSWDENATVSFTIVRTGNADQTLRVDWAFANSLVVPSAGTVQFAPGDVTKTIFVTVLPTVGTVVTTLSLSNPVYVSGSVTVIPQLGPPSSAQVTVVDLSGTDSLAEGSINVFLDPVNGNDAYNGLHATFKGGTSGPKKTWTGVKALNLVNKVGIYMKEGTTTTQENFHNQSDFVGTSTQYRQISAYHLINNVPFQGINNAARPIIQGTTNWMGYDGSNKPAITSLWPTPTSTSINFGFMIGQSIGTDCFWEVSWLHVRHAGSRGIGGERVRGFKVHDCWIEKTLGQAVLFNECLTGGSLICERNVALGNAGGQVYYAHTDHPAIFAVAETDFRGEPEPITFRNNICGLNWGENFDAFRGAYNVLFEDNSSFDTDRVKYYADAAEDVVFRRNLAFQSGKTTLNNCSGIRQENAFSLQGGEAYMYVPQGSFDPLVVNTRNVAVYANVAIGTRAFMTFWDSHQAQVGGGATDMEHVWIFRNTVINADAEIDEFNGSWTVSNGRISDNMFLAFNDGAHNFEQTIERGTWVNQNNAFSGTIGAMEAGWTNNLTATWSGETTGWDTLHTLTPGWTADFGLSMQAAVDFVAAVKLRLENNLPTGDCAAGGRAWTNPPTITTKPFENTDFFGNEYLANDVGAISAGAAAATIIVRADGAGGAFTTVTSALAAAVPGDIIEVQADVAGSYQEWNEQIVFPVGKEGTLANLITLRGREGDNIVLYAVNGIILRMDFNRYFFLDNFQLGRDHTINGWPHAAGLAEDWATFYSATLGGRSQVEHTRTAYITNSHWLRFDRIRAYGGNLFDSFHIESTCSYVGVLYSNLSHAGTNGDEGTLGNCITCEGANCVFMYNFVWQGGHDTIHLESPNCIIQNNAFDGSTSRYYPNSPFPGNRPQATEGSKGATPYGPNVSEGNLFFGADLAGDEAESPGCKIIGWNMVARGNAFFDNHAQCWNTLPLQEEAMQAGDGIRAYNNVGYNIGSFVYSSNVTTRVTDPNTGQLINTPVSDGFYKEWKIFNNVMVNIDAVPAWNAGFHVNILRQYTTTTVQLTANGGYPNAWRGGEWYKNYFGFKAGGQLLTRLRWLNTGGTVSGSVNTSLAAVQADWPTEWHDNFENSALTLADPSARLVDFNAQWEADPYSMMTVIPAVIDGLKVASGVGIGAADPQTIAVGAGSGTQITVEDPYMFFHPDAAPYSFQGFFPELLPDWIKIGATAPVQLTDIDYNTGVLTLAAARTWANGDAVFYAGKDGTTWTNLGPN